MSDFDIKTCSSGGQPAPSNQPIELGFNDGDMYLQQGNQKVSAGHHGIMNGDIVAGYAKRCISHGTEGPAHDMSVREALVESAKDICSPDRTVDVRVIPGFKEPSVQDLNKFCTGNPYKSSGANIT